MGMLAALCLAGILTLAASADDGSPGPFPQLRPTRLRFFWHNKGSEPNATSVTVAQGASNNSTASSFGTLVAFDDPLTFGPNVSSELIGRSQGVYVKADQNAPGLLMVMTFIFYGPRYDGSTLVVVGRNEKSSFLSELPIVGGSGVFRFATGYVQVSPTTEEVSADIQSVEYNCYIGYTELPPVSPP